MIDVVYLALALGFAAWNATRLRLEPDRWIVLTLLVGAASAALGVLGGPWFFDVVRLVAWGVFLVMPLWCLAAAWITRPTAPRAAIALLAAAVAVAVVGVDAFLVEPHALQLTRYEVVTDRVDRPLRIGLVADLQTADPGAYELGALRRMLAERPDVLLFAGDYLQERDREAWTRKAPAMRAMLQAAQLSAPEGAWAVRGNVDPTGWEALWDGTGVTPVETTTRFRTPRFTLSALGFEDGFDPGLVVPGDHQLHIALAHGPDYALGQVAADLLLAGHTHGGQVRVPLIAFPLLTFSQVPRGWAAGRTDLPSGGTLIVSRGVGMERSGAPPLRFACPPEIVVIDVVPRAP